MPRRVVVVPHNPAWPEMYRTESRLVLRALGENALDAHHIGSTAIASIPAKPVIDMLIVVADLASVDDRSAAMVELGYEALGECGIPQRRYFRKSNQAGVRTHHVHAFPRGNDQIRRHLAFRDFLATHSDWAKRYGDLKTELAAKHADSIERYMDGKDGFIQHVDHLAAAWQAADRA